MPATLTCPRCGRPLSDDAPQGLCPVCLLHAALSSDTSLATSAGADPTGTASPPTNRVGDYEVLEELGRGGMGVVYKARQKSLDRVVALKMILGSRLVSDLEVRRFKAEAEAAAQLDHPNIVQVHEVGEHEGQHFFSMRLVEGRTLAQCLPDLARDPRACARLLALVARAVHSAHQRGVLHRDLKPGNILLDAEGQPHVTDFGLARKIEGDSGLTQSGAIVGTPNYMAPEQAAGKGRGLTTAADVWALGAILYECLTARPPFQGESVMETLLQVIEQEPQRPRALNPRADRDLEVICLKCLNKDPQRRYGSAEALADDLERWLRGEPILARSSGSWERIVKWARRRPATAALLAVSVAAVLSVGVLVVALWRNAEVQKTALNEKADALEVKAETESKLKEQESGRAKDAERHALALTEERDRVVEQEFRARSHLYAWEMYEAQRGLANRDLPQVLDLLNRHRPGPSQRDVRGCEWHYLWRLCHGQRQTLRLPAEGSWVAFSPDGKTLATQVFGGELKLWEAATGKEKTALKFVGGDRCLALRFSPGGTLLAVAVAGTGTDKGEVRLYDAARLKLLASVPHEANQLLFSGDGKVLAAGRLGGGGRPIKVWDLDDPSHPKERPLAPGQGQVDGLVSLDLSRDGRSLAAAFRMGGVRLWQLPTGQARAPLKLDPSEDMPVGSVALSPDGKTLATAHGTQFIFGASYQHGACRVALWDVTTGKLRRSLRGHTGGVHTVVFSPDGSWLASVSGDATRTVLGGKGENSEVKLWYLSTGYAARSFHQEQTGFVDAVAFSPDSETLAMHSHDNAVVVANVSDGNLHPVPCWHAGPVTDLAFSPDSQTLATAGTDRVVKLWNLGGDKPFTLPRNEITYTAVGYSPDGKTLVTGGRRGVTLWEASSLKRGAVLEGHRNWVRRVAFSRDGRLLASGSDDGTIKVWDVNTGKERTSLRWRPRSLTPRDRLFGDAESLDGLGFSADGAALTATTSKAAVTWELATGMSRGRLDWSTERERPRIVALAPDGKTVLVHTFDFDKDREALKLWDVSTGKEVRTIFTSQGGDIEETGLRRHRQFRGAFSPDGKAVVVGEAYRNFVDPPRRVRVFDLATGKETATLQGPEWEIELVTFTPEGGVAAGWFAYDMARVRLWDLATGQPRTDLFLPSANINHRTLQDHFAVAFPPDGKTVAAMNLGSLALWDAETGRQRVHFRGDKAVLAHLAFRADSKPLAVVLRENRLAWTDTVEVWDAETEKPLVQLEDLPPGGARQVAWSGDGRSVAVAGEGEVVTLYDAATQKERATLQGHKGAVLSVQFSPDSRSLATGGEDGSVRLWDAATGRSVAALGSHRGAVPSVAFALDGKSLASGSADGTVKLWDVVSRRERRTIREQGEAVWSVAWGAGNETLAWAAGRSRSEVVLWNVAGGKERGRLQGHAAGVRCLALTADGKTLATGSTDGIVRLWDAGPGKERAEFRKRREKADHPLGVSSVAFSSDGSLLASGGVDGTAKLWDLSQGDPRATLDRDVFKTEVRSVAFAPDGKTLGVARVDGLVLLWDLARLTSPILKSLWRNVTPLATSLDGKILATAQDDRAVRLWDLATGRQRAALRGHDGDKLCAAFSPDGKLLATGEGDHDRAGTVRLWDAGTGELLASLTRPSGRVEAVAFSSDGKLLAGAIGDEVKVWDVRTRQVRATLQGRGPVAFSPDGKVLAVTTRDGLSVMLWDIKQSVTLTTFKAHDKTIHVLAFHPNGRTLATGSEDWSVRLWNVATGRLLLTLRRDLGEARRLAFSPDGARLSVLGTSIDGRTRITSWNLTPIGD